VSDDGDLHPARSLSWPATVRRATGYRRWAMPIEDPLRVDSQLAIPLAEIELRASRSSGPGGQHANVTASRIEAVFDVEASPSLSARQRERLLARLGPRVTAVAQDTRSQTRNRELALERLRDRLAAALAVRRRRRTTKPTRAARERRLSGKRHRSEVKRARRRPPASGD
jgi:ribosome-associated protein